MPASSASRELMVGRAVPEDALLASEAVLECKALLLVPEPALERESALLANDSALVRDGAGEPVSSAE